MIKNVTNTNRLMQRETLSFTLVVTVFVMIPLIILQAPLVLIWLHNTWTLFNARINLSLAWIRSWTIGLPPKCKTYLLLKMPVLFPKNPEILSHKKCLDYTSKHLRWLTRILQTLTQYEKVTKNLYKINSKMMHLSHAFFIMNMYFYIWNDLDLQSAKRIISRKIFQSLQKWSQLNIWI